MKTSKFKKLVKILAGGEGSSISLKLLYYKDGAIVDCPFNEAVSIRDEVLRIYASVRRFKQFAIILRATGKNRPWLVPAIDLMSAALIRFKTKVFSVSSSFSDEKALTATELDKDTSLFLLLTVKASLAKNIPDAIPS
jgi:hypothetical protein